ncbi:DksA/TraR family C4-type zinc finger protein [Oceanisphaera sp. W20_SRM_FM3]|uniref:DksA/TraR family C4-type zinc finger protein n=1 Tax=Oceanisphaera sp. W20_SRM_FM3 TaxID=3240267 RepID=UPI003F98DD65
MAVGWAKDGAVQEQIDASVADAVTEARSQLNLCKNMGDSLSHCEECEALIPEARRYAVPGVRLCINCQAEQERYGQRAGIINRRASKDSQLR